MSDPRGGINNLLLATLSSDEHALLAPHLTRHRLELRQVLVAAGQPVEYVWFPEGGVASVVTELGEGGVTEVGILGREGFAGTPLLLGADTSQHKIFMQVDGHPALRIEAACFLDALDQCVTLRATLLRYVQTFITQNAHNSASNAHQRIEARLARWLLMCHDRCDGDSIPLTHEFMAMMISAERSGVTVALHMLEGAGMIHARRGAVAILDRLQLEGLAGGGYGKSEAEYRDLIAPFGKSTPRVYRKTAWPEMDHVKLP